ncbi:cytochrome P450 CYP82D47-like [Cucumis melo var. makuwa]|nr:cytochrome P450 CYP82D47-like [Cucumis melo var. makuwa]
MVIYESNANGSSNNNFYVVLDEVLQFNIQWEKSKDTCGIRVQSYQHVPFFVRRGTSNSCDVATPMDEYIEDDDLCKTDVDPTIVERSIVHHVTDDFIGDGMNNCHIKVEQATTNDSDKPRTMSSFPSGFNKTDAMFHEFTKDLNNIMKG